MRPTVKLELVYTREECPDREDRDSHVRSLSHAHAHTLTFLNREAEQHPTGEEAGRGGGREREGERAYMRSRTNACLF